MSTASAKCDRLPWSCSFLFRVQGIEGREGFLWDMPFPWSLLWAYATGQHHRAPSFLPASYNIMSFNTVSIFCFSHSDDSHLMLPSSSLTSWWSLRWMRVIIWPLTYWITKEYYVYLYLKCVWPGHGNGGSDESRKRPHIPRTTEGAWRSAETKD